MCQCRSIDPAVSERGYGTTMVAALSLGVGVTSSLGTGVGVGLGSGLGVGSGVSDGVGVGVGLGAGVGVGDGLDGDVVAPVVGCRLTTAGGLGAVVVPAAVTAGAVVGAGGWVVGAGVAVRVTAGSATRSSAARGSGELYPAARMATARPDPETTAAASARNASRRPGSARRCERITRSSSSSSR
jgi:hypothetical protein